jgi:membrane protease subunit (stomatin/prohibitin family)
MSLWDKIVGEFVDVIEWTDDSDDTMVHRFQRHGNEIKYGAKLTVRESQVAVFVNEGRLADVFQPGMYELEVANLPIFSTLENWHHGFESPFKAEVYFVNTKQFTDLKWGTKNPLMLRDKEFGALRLRAFGSYVLRVADAAVFIKEISGTDGHFTTDEVTDQLRNIIVSRFADILGESGIPVLDLAANYDDLGAFLTNKIKPEFAAYGLELTLLLVENISLPPEVEKALDKRTSMGVIGNLKDYAQFQAAEAMVVAADNPGGMAAGGMGMGMGIAMGQQMGQAMGAGTVAAASSAPPPIPRGKLYYLAVDGKQAGPFALSRLNEQLEAGVLVKDTLVWTDGLSDWTKAQDCGELASLFAQMPPPLPKA